MDVGGCVKGTRYLAYVVLIIYDIGYPVLVMLTD